VLLNTYQERFSGYASAIFIEKVHDKLIRKVGNKEICLVDNGYSWIQRLPLKKNWAITTMFDDKGNIVEWYFDITKLNSIDEKGQPFYDDLYLDVVVLPSGEVVLLDEDELIDALERGVITQGDFELAYSIANNIMDGMAKDIIHLANMSYNDLEFFRTQTITSSA